MKNVKRLSILMLMLVFALLLFNTNISARSISFNPHLISATVNRDGSVNVEEWITYNFSGEYNGVSQNIGYVMNSSYML